MRVSLLFLSCAIILGCSNESPRHTPGSVAIVDYETGKGDAIYVIRRPDAPWGDYGRILTHGTEGNPNRKWGKDAPLQLERTGPFVPPITFPGIGNIVVTDELKQEMERADFRGISFRAVEKTHIVELSWHNWDLTTEEPKTLPISGEPVGYILDELHSEELAASLGPIWEIVLSDSAKVIRCEDPISNETTFPCVEGSWNGNDLFSVSENYHIYASARAKAWLEDHAGEWTSFRDVEFQKP